MRNSMGVNSQRVFPTGMSAWYDPSNNATLTLSSGVQQMNDLSGNGRHVTQGTAANRPSIGTLNGRQALVFNNAHWLTRAQFMYALGSVTIFAVVNSNQPGDKRILAEGSTATTTPIYGFQGCTTTGELMHTAVQLRANDAVIQVNQGQKLGDSSLDGANNIICWTDSGSLITAYKNGVAGDSPIAYTRSGASSLTTFAIGALVRPTVIGHFSGTIGEIIIYPRVLSAVERNRAITYLTHKWLS